MIINKNLSFEDTIKMTPVKIKLDLQNPLLFTLVESPSMNDKFYDEVLQKMWVERRGHVVLVKI